MTSGKCWSYGVGKRGLNRVRVRERKPAGRLYIEWHENGKRVRKSFKQFCGTHVTDRKVAVELAQHFSERLGAGEKHAMTDQLMKLSRRRGTEAALRERIALPVDDLLQHRLPTEPLCGVYFLISQGEVTYVGQSRDVMARLAQHRKRPPAPFDSAAFQAFSVDELDRAEALYIDRFNPPGNLKNVWLRRNDPARADEEATP